MNEVVLGTYRHYKGGMYRVIGVAKHTETSEDVVVYEALDAETFGSLWVRPLQMFMETVVVDGVAVPRFTHIGQ